MSQQEFDYPEPPYEAQRSELAYDEQRREWRDEVPLGEWPDALRDYHLPGEKLIPSRTRVFPLPSWIPAKRSLSPFLKQAAFSFRARNIRRIS